MLFLSGNLPPTSAAATLVVPRNGIPAATAKFGGYMPAVWSKFGLNGGQMLGSRTAVQLVSGDGAPHLEAGPPDPDPAFAWNAADPATATVSAFSPAARFLVGFPGPSWLGFHGLDVTPDAPGSFLSVALVSRDGKPIADSNSLLLTAASRFENQDDVWNTARTSVGNQWGHGPVLGHAAPASIGIETGATAATVYALDATGARLKTVPSTLTNGKLQFHVGPDAGTVWYEIAATR